MTSCSRLVSIATALALVDCGKSTREQPRAPEAKLGEASAGTAGKPADKVAAPAKAPSRGPERPVYSLVDNRLSAHLTRGGGLLVPAGSAAFAKYNRFGNMM